MPWFDLKAKIPAHSVYRIKANDEAEAMQKWEEDHPDCSLIVDAEPDEYATEEFDSIKELSPEVVARLEAKEQRDVMARAGLKQLEIVPMEEILR